MPKTFIVIIPTYIEDDEDSLSEYIASIQEEYADALDQTANPRDSRSSVDDISIDFVKIYKEHIDISYTVEYSAYHGCRDANYADSDQREIVAARSGRVLTFENHHHPSPLSPNEEL